jgi:hypothetical protein
MKFKNEDIYVALGGQEPLFSKLTGMKWPVRTAYALAKMASKLNDQFKVIEDVRLGLIKRYGEVNEKGNTEIKQTVLKDGIETPNPLWAAFVGEFNELMGQEVEIVVEKVKLPQKTGTTDVEIEPNILLALEKFIEVE